MGISIQSPAHSANATYTLTLPTSNGNANQLLKTDGSGVLTWADASGGAFKQMIETSATTWGATSSTTYVDVAGISASITTTGGSSTVMVQVFMGGAVSHPGIRGFCAIQNYTASSSTQFQESAIVIGDNDSGSPAQSSFSNGCVIHSFTGLAAQTWNFRARWRQHGPSGSWNNSRALGAMVLWELA